MARKIRVVAFDVFGTVFDMSGIDRSQVNAYVSHVKSDEWKPLVLPDSWYEIPAHADSAQGIYRLRRDYQVVTCSNGPMQLLTAISKRAGIDWDGIIPIELNRVYKTDPRAYMTICELMGVEPREVMFVTANPAFGDVEASKALGMEPMVIRHGYPETIIDLANLMQDTEC